ncbi:MAG: hypothetical protein AABY03_00395 [Nanoarchaeota archaeon]
MADLEDYAVKQSPEMNLTELDESQLEIFLAEEKQRKSLPVDFFEFSLREFQKGKKVDFLNVRDFLMRFRKKSFDNSALKYYSIIMNSGIGYVYLDESSGKKDEVRVSGDEIYSDGDFQFILTQRNNPAAILSFSPDGNGILVGQIQGVKGMGDSLSSLKWSRALLNLATTWASIKNVPEIRVLPYKENAYKVVRENKNGAEFYYDITAKKEGFVYDSARSLYVKELEGRNE